jgi:hypothetical protein
MPDSSLTSKPKGRKDTKLPDTYWVKKGLCPRCRGEAGNEACTICAGWGIKGDIGSRRQSGEEDPDLVSQMDLDGDHKS